MFRVLAEVNQPWDSNDLDQQEIPGKILTTKLRCNRRWFMQLQFLRMIKES